MTTFRCQVCLKDKGTTEQDTVSWVSNIGYRLWLKSPAAYKPLRFCKPCRKKVMLLSLSGCSLIAVFVSVLLFWWLMNQFPG